MPLTVTILVFAVYKIKTTLDLHTAVRACCQQFYKHHLWWTTPKTPDLFISSIELRDELYRLDYNQCRLLEKEPYFTGERSACVAIDALSSAVCAKGEVTTSLDCLHY